MTVDSEMMNDSFRMTFAVVLLAEETKLWMQ